MFDALETISLSRLRIFLTICETPHLARTAERLGITQPALSQKLRNLEDALKVKLFDRQHRRLELTAAGKVCREEADKIVAMHSAMVENVRRTARGYAGKINLGYVPSAMYGRRLVSQLRKANEKFPDVEVSLCQQNPVTLLTELNTNRLDIAFICAPVNIEPPLVFRRHSRQKMLVALPKGHKLSLMDEIPLSLLTDENLIAPQGPDDIGIMQVILSAAEKMNIKLSIKSHIPELNGVLALVSAGYGYSIIPEDLIHTFSDSIAFRPLNELDVCIEYWLVWNPLSISPAINNFINLLIEN